METGQHYSKLPQAPTLPSWQHGRWVVIRHGGNSQHRWRQLAVGDRRSDVNAQFNRAYDRVRAGALAMLDPDGVVIRYVAPTPRRRS